jgi:hypothetical protein
LSGRPDLDSVGRGSGRGLHGVNVPKILLLARDGAVILIALVYVQLALGEEKVVELAAHLASPVYH